jgi:hypothetical protein
MIIIYKILFWILHLPWQDILDFTKEIEKKPSPNEK